MASSTDPDGEPTQPVRSLDLEEIDELRGIDGIDRQGPGGGSPGPSAQNPVIASAVPNPALTSAEPAKPSRRRGTFRYRILPRSVLGVSSMILAFAIGAGFSGVVLFSYYQYKANQTNARVNALVSGYKHEFANAEGQLAATAAAAQASIQQELKAEQQLEAGPQQLASLTKQVAPSVFFVHTLNSGGQASVATAFVVSSNPTQSLLITSYTAVEAATQSPGPAVYVRQNGVDTQVSVRSWDPQYDLALLILPIGNLRALTAAPTAPQPQPGDRLYAVSGLGSSGASLSAGTVVDVIAQGLATDTPIGASFQGGPVINSSAQVVAVASLAYSPLGFSTSGIVYLPYVEAACNRVLVCPGGTLVGAH